MKKTICLCLVLALTLCGCGGVPEQKAPEQETLPTEAGSATPIPTPKQSASDYFSDRDFDDSYAHENSTRITLNGSSADCGSDKVRIDGSVVTITDEGSYILTGTLDGMLIVDAEKTDKLQLVLENASICSKTSAALYIRQADKVFVTSAEGTENSLTNGGSFEAIDDSNIDGAVYSKEDLTLNGEGKLSITSPTGHGIVSKDSLTVTGGVYEIICASHGLTGKDDVSVAGGIFTIEAGKDGIHAENVDDAALGVVYIGGGTFAVTAEGDGISAAATAQIDGGTFTIVTGGGSENGTKDSSDGWGFMGGGPGGMGGRPGDRSDFPNDSTQDTTDSASMKAIMAGTGLTITGGTFTINSADDAIHTNGSATVSGGAFTIATGDDGFHADETLTIVGGTVTIAESYEGLEGLHIAVSGGDITLTAGDDGINAAGGTDQSGTQGGRDGMFGGMGGGRPGGPGGMSAGNGSITISGGTLNITASGDGIDANGSLSITGGYTTVCGPTQGDTATLDYDTSATISGGTFIGTGASGMAQTFSDSEQGVFAVSVGNQSAGTRIVLTDSSGKIIIDHAPALSFAVVILSSPDIVKGESYTITVGGQSGTFNAN